MARVRAFAICAALVLAPSVAEAESGLTESLRLQGAYTHQTAGDDLTGFVIPTLSYFTIAKRAQLRLTYAFTFAVHTTDPPADIANRVSLGSSFELSQRTGLVLNADAFETTVNNALVSQPSAVTTVTTLPTGTTRIVTAHVGQGLSHQLTPVVRVGQGLDGSYTTTLGDSELKGWYTGGAVSIDREWVRDALGADIRGAYTFSHQPPPPPPAVALPDQEIGNIGLTPHWRHDISRRTTGYVAAGASYVFSPAKNTRRIIKPFGLASLLYQWDDAEVDLSYGIGVAPNSLTAQLFDANRVTLHASSPISVRYHISGGASVSYTHGRIVNLYVDPTIPPTPDSDAVFGDVELGWSPSDFVSAFARYQIFDQIASGDTTLATTTGSEIRHVVLFGVAFASRLDAIKIRTRLPQRVDRGDPP